MTDTGHPGSWVNTKFLTPDILGTPKVNSDRLHYITIPEKLPLLCGFCLSMALRSEVVALPLSVCLHVFLGLCGMCLPPSGLCVYTYAWVCSLSVLFCSQTKKSISHLSVSPQISLHLHGLLWPPFLVSESRYYILHTGQNSWFSYLTLPLSVIKEVCHHIQFRENS